MAFYLRSFLQVLIFGLNHNCMITLYFTPYKVLAVFEVVDAVILSCNNSNGKNNVTLSFF